MDTSGVLTGVGRIKGSGVQCSHDTSDSSCREAVDDENVGSNSWVRGEDMYRGPTFGSEDSRQPAGGKPYVKRHHATIAAYAHVTAQGFRWASKHMHRSRAPKCIS
jgi:hypothetical protein